MSSKSVWLATSNAAHYPQIDADLHVDVVVIGGGITGLTAALLAQRAGMTVAVIEARTIGAGTTGRTTGKATSQHGLIYRDLADRHGEQAAHHYAAANEAGLGLIAGFAGEFDFDCGFTRAPSYVYSTDADHTELFGAEAETAAVAGLPATLDNNVGLPFPVAAAVRFDDQAHLHPGRYLAGLAHALTAAGGHIYEESRATSVEETGNSVRVTVGNFIATGADCIVATLLPIGTIGGCFARTTPVRSYGLALRLAAAAPTSMTISADADGYSTRPWPQAGPNGLIVVGEGHQVGAEVDTALRYEYLEQWARSTFEVTSVDYRWSAQDYTTADGLPYIGRVPTRLHISVATGFAKWGLTNGTAAAMMIVDGLTGTPQPWLDTFSVGRIGDARALIDTAKNAVVSGAHLVKDAFSGDTPTCTHLGCSLRWNSAETSWDCPCHGSRFTAQGAVLEGPAVLPLDFEK